MLLRVLRVGLIAVVALAGVARAELQPAEVAVVARRGDKNSEGLARYYCRQRQVPEANICLIDAPDQEEVPAELWRWAIRPEVRKWLDENDPQRKLRCLVTVWGVPLKIAATPSGEGNAKEAAARSSLDAYRKHLDGERDRRLTILKRLTTALDELGGGALLADALAAAEGEKKETTALERLKGVQTRLEAALRAAQARVQGMPDATAKAEAAQRLQQLATAAGGARVLLQGMDQQLGPALAANKKVLDAGPEPATAPQLSPQLAELRSQFDQLRGRASAFAEIKLLMDQSPPSIERDALILATLQQNGGLLASIEWLNEQIGVVEKNETGAAFDSELSLVLWDDGYELLRWQPNYLRAIFDDSQLRETFPTLMVARIDAPTVELAKRLIDTAIQVEKQGGVKGKAYFDARGMAKLEGPPYAPGSYEDYDRAVLVTAKGFEEETEITTVLNDKPELFQPGECPDAALYCGWYSLAKYVDAFEWAPGAVAYHLASGELATLRTKESQVWCKRMLEEGVCATIGPVYEPYLVSFPRPNEFFAVLLQGELPLVEAYYRTQPFTSWQQALIGDPLYHPFPKRAPKNSMPVVKP
ncbi:MAG: TIGR03790 family protein [Lacipirellulaceae bacterium]